ncbi:Transcription factor spt20 [Microbotryomycetes sp. JL201]|nr:Transcription factor spt20 [Microbotryomycetes sp. JL201]
MVGATYNVTRFTRQVLKRYRKEPPSLVLHLYPTHFRFEQQHGNFSYDSPMKCFLEAIREQRLPTDLLDVLDDAGIRYYEGCLIVEVHDHRAAPAPVAHARSGLSGSFQLARTSQSNQGSKAEVYRIVLGPNPATLWTDMGIMERRMIKESQATDNPLVFGWTEEEAVEVEAVLLNRTTAPLCLSPSLQTTRIANSMLGATSLRPPKRKRPRDGEQEEELDEEEGLRREREEYERMMKLGDEGIGRGRSHAFARLAFIQAYRERQNNPAPAQGGPGVTSIRITAAQGSGHSTAAASPAATGVRKGGSVAPDGASEAGTPGPSAGSFGYGNAAAQIKKVKKSTSVDPNDPTLPTDPAERERELEKRRKAAKKRADAKLRKEKKLAAAAAVQQANDLQVGGAQSPGVGTPTSAGGSGLKISLGSQQKYGWNA